MKEKEVYLADLRSLKENISNKIMEAIQDLEAKNLKKIEKKIEKASQKIAMGLIKASLKNAELLTRKITNAIGPVNSNKASAIQAGKKRGRPTLNKIKEDLTGFESSTLKTILENSSKVLKKRGRPSKSTLERDSTINKAISQEGSATAPKKRGRPFGAKSKLTVAASLLSPKGRRGRPKSVITPSNNLLTESSSTVALRKRGRPKLFAKSNSENPSSTIIPIKGRRGRPAKVKSDLNDNPNTDIAVNATSSFPKTRGRKPKVQNLISSEKLNEKKSNSDHENPANE